jgi:hypothetical protein
MIAVRINFLNKFSNMIDHRYFIFFCFIFYLLIRLLLIF